MKTLALILLIGALQASAVQEWTDLIAKWSTTAQDASRTNSWFGIPRTLSAAVTAGWVDATETDDDILSIYCLPDDPRFCVLFDSYGYVAGFQAATLVSDVKNIQGIYDMSGLDQYERKTILGQDVWTSTAYTRDPAVLANGGSGIWDNLTGTDAVWLQSNHGIIKVPRLTKDLDSVWVEENCVPAMGKHYYFNIHKTTACKDIQPWFLITHEGSAGFSNTGAPGKIIAVAPT